MNANHRPAHLSIWVFAFGYFAFYAPYSMAVKVSSKGLWPGMEGSLTQLEILPGFLLGAASVVLLFITVTGWWRYVPRRKTLATSILWPRPLAALSGVGTAAIITATTLAYTFHGISIVFALLLMRGGVLIMAPIVDAVFQRKVAWNSWLGLVLSLAAVSLALADQDSYVLSLAAVINLAVYYLGYTIRLQCITASAKSEDPEFKYSFFAEEQTVSMLLLLAGCVLLVIYGIVFGTGTPNGSVLLKMFSVPTLVIGVLYGCLFLFGSLIYMDARENCFCIPINRCSSVMAGLFAGTAMVYLFDQPPVTGTQLVAAGFIIAAIVSLAQNNLAALWQRLLDTGPTAEKLLLFVCDGNVSRSAIAEAICRSEFTKRLNLKTASGGTSSLEIKSAGLSAEPDSPMSPKAQLALNNLNVDPGKHAAQNASRELVDKATVIFCMTKQQVSDLAAIFPHAVDKIHLLDRNKEINLAAERTAEDYLACAEHIRSSILDRIDEMSSLITEDLAVLPKFS